MTSYQTPKSLKKTNRRLLKENLKLKKKCMHLSNSNTYFHGNRNGVTRRLFTCDQPRLKFAEHSGIGPSASMARPVSAFSQTPPVSAFSQPPSVSAFSQPLTFPQLQFGNYSPPVSAFGPQVSAFAQQISSPSPALTMHQLFNQMLTDHQRHVGPSGSLFAQSSQPVSAFTKPLETSPTISAFSPPSTNTDTETSPPVSAFAPQRTYAFSGVPAFYSSFGSFGGGVPQTTSK